MTTILVALDLEEGSDVVLARAMQLADAHAASLIVLHVIDRACLSDMAVHVDDGEDSLRDRLRRQTLALIESLVARSGRDGRTEVQVEFGAAHDSIIQAACASSVDAIVLGPGRGHTLKERFLGSTADRVIRGSAVPVLVVRKPSVAPYARVAVAIDGSKASAEAFIAARRLVPAATLRLVHAVDIPLPFQQAMVRAGTTQAEMEEYRVTRVRQARAELGVFRRGLPGGSALPVRFLRGEPGRALVRLSRTGGLDLLALGSRGRGAAAEALIGSVARRVLGEAACDVLVVNVRR